VGRRKHKFNHIRQMVPMCPHERAHCCHLANMIEPSVCGGDAVLRQITLATCYASVGIGGSLFSVIIQWIVSYVYDVFCCNCTVSVYEFFLWPPYVIGGPLYFCPVISIYLSFYLFFPRLISAAVDWMSAILLHMVWP